MLLLSLMITPRRRPGHPFGKVHGKSAGNGSRDFRLRRGLEQAIPSGSGRTAVRVAQGRGRSEGALEALPGRGSGSRGGACAGAHRHTPVRAVLTQMMDHASAE
ncbi:hypothetical protein GCM10010359_36060 [Streptomyces morookaense]|nr:hypothetical protein GCM10010359_36060 [Streptomyces morookaense]